MKLFRRLSYLLALTPLFLSGAAMAEGLDELPQDIQQSLYNKDMLDPQQPIGPSAYRDWKAKRSPPWTHFGQA